jgi:fructokinase
MDKTQLICFGEILWDIFPHHKVIGGAPLNVALRLHAFNAQVQIISSLGKDEHGEAVLGYLGKQELSKDLIQQHETLETGTVLITLDESGSATYEIRKPVAWDAIALTPAMVAAVKEAPFFLFGSLALRGTYNHSTLRRLLEVANTRIFDVNLRPPYYDISMIYELMQLADFIKLNDEELEEVCAGLGCQETTMELQVAWLVKITKTPSICVTMGDKGALLFYKSKFYDHPGYKVMVNDTVGAGDSFLATLINELFLNENSPQDSLARACAIGALVASKAGANCGISEVEISELME